MEKEFIEYEQAIALKKLGFDEPCFGYYDGNHNLQFMYNGKPEKFTEKKMGPADSVWVGWISAPLYQQAFRWFREKYGWTIKINKIVKDTWSFTLENFTLEKELFGGRFNSYKEAELECLKKLIEIVKKQKKDESNIIV